jgi:penicillin-binding protein 1B
LAVRIKLGRPSGSAGKFFASDLGRKTLRVAFASMAAVVLVLIGIAAFYYYRYEKIVDKRLTQPLFATTAKIYAAPREVRVGQKLTVNAVAQELRQAGYSDSSENHASGMGRFEERADSIYIHPGPESYHSQDGATVNISKGLVTQISGDQGQQLAAYELEPLLITGLSEDVNRTKRRLITYDEIPNNLVQAVLAIEDRRFFEHGGVNYYRLMMAMFKDVRSGQKAQGGSTLTMQLARGFFLSPEKRLKRKLIEIAITFQLEHRFNKKQIFEMYANQINLGQRGSFSINGFGEASKSYFGKDVQQLDLAQCALLAGMIQRPNYFSPYKHPERALERRNLVLDSMVETGAISRQQADAAKASPLKLAPMSVDASEAPYFVDLVRDQLNQKLGERDFNREGLRIYTSLDPDLQRAAAEAVEIGMKNVDQLILKAHSHKEKDGTLTASGNITYPQVALIALNPHTGQVLALVGGRNYGISQLNHAVAKRPTGSIFKPFVYAAAFNSSLSGAQLEGQDAVFSPVTMLSDEQTTYNAGSEQEYTPRNYHSEYHDQVTARFALQKSLNNATISLAQMVGFNNVASLARDAGIKSARGTPAVALGAYDATPLDMAGAYTVFANNGVKIDPWMLASVRTSSGDVVTDYAPDSKPILDPRVAYLTTSLMQNVVNAGTGYEVRRRGFMAPAAGKTGTSHDAWFAGFTSNLICIVWVGNDDYTDIKQSGTAAAAPIWAEFMKLAVQLPQYSDTHDFAAPAGIVEVQIDKVTNLLSNATCPDSYNISFLEGTAPTETCDHANGDQRNLFQKLFGIGEKTPPANTINGQPPALPPAQPNSPGAADANANSADNPDAKKKKGFFGKVFGSLKSNDTDKKPAPQQPQPAPHQ